MPRSMGGWKKLCEDLLADMCRGFKLQTPHRPSRSPKGRGAPKHAGSALYVELVAARLMQRARAHRQRRTQRAKVSTLTVIKNLDRISQNGQSLDQWTNCPRPKPLKTRYHEAKNRWDRGAEPASEIQTA